MPGPASQGLVLSIREGKPTRKGMLAFVGIPTGEDGSLPPAALHFAVANLQDMG